MVGKPDKTPEVEKDRLAGRDGELDASDQEYGGAPPLASIWLE